ncbi:hypothetical protein [Kitasatospora purpeofusca]|uniref:hypothetical protein n=1 Tax=Kitasatospora purpeofusca TaxID=67352 RepID=UPI002A59988F|nr:hypothetical protein [Kitasatospora purpeofusca]MDY0814526.1 hypothetical protein [Kitasatospora purpeofusca]
MEQAVRVDGLSAGRPVAGVPEGVRDAVVVAVPFDAAVVGFGGCMAMLAASGVRLRVVVSGGGPASRAAVSREALASLGAPQAELEWLEGTRCDEGVRHLSLLVKGADLCAAPWCGDRGTAVGSARWAALLACSLRLRPPLVEYWVPGHCASRDCGEPWQRASRVSLPPGAERLKRRALCAGGVADPASGRESGASVGATRLGSREILFL